MFIRRLAPCIAALALLSAPSIALAQAPKAVRYQTFLTDPSAGTLASLKLTKPTKVLVKTKPGSVEFQLVMSKVLDGAMMPANSINNTLQVDMLIGGAFSTQNFLFDIVDGKVSPSTKKFPVANGSLPGVPAPGDPIEIVGVRVREGGTGHIFGAAGITLR